MGFENKYPYTDFHEMNLDWILDVVKGIETEWPEFRTEMQTAWQQYQDNLTGEGGEWPTFRDEMTQDFDDFIHLFIDEFDNMHAYTVGDYVVQDGQVYKCEALPSPSHALPIEFDEYTWLRISNGVINQFSHEIMAIESSVKTFVERMVPEYSDQEYYNKDMIVRKASTFAPTFPYDFYIAKQLITPETWTPSHWERVNSFAQAINDVCAINKQEMQDQYDQFLEDYQRTFGVVQTRGSSTTDVMSQKAVSDELQAHDDMIDNLIKDIAPVYDSTKAYKIGNLLTYLGKQYYCIADAPAGTLPTNTTYFEEKSVADIIEMIKAGTIVPDLANNAKNLTPYSEDSGAIQDTPFISQETGTANNTVIVTTGDTAKQLEKLGNAIVVNDWAREVSGTYYSSPTSDPVTFADGVGTLTATQANGRVITRSNYRFTALAGHKYLGMCSIKLTTATDEVQFLTTTYNANTSATTAWQTVYLVLPINTETPNFYVGVRDTRTADWDAVQFKDIHVIDLTQWFNGNDNIPADLLANPSHFTWYYNGLLTYNAGKIKHGNGVKLVCTRGRNLFNTNTIVRGKYIESNGTEVSSANFNHSDYIPVVPNTVMYVKNINTAQSVRIVICYDKNKNFLRTAPIGSNYHYYVIPENCWFVIVNVNNTDLAGQTLTPYYTSEQGGEGYENDYPYEEPDIIDTGSEQLGAFDKKTPDGVIHRKTIDVAGIADSEIASVVAEGSMWRVFLNSTSPIYHKTTSYPALICASYAKAGNYADVKLNDKTIGITANGEYIMLHDSSLADATAVRTALATLAMQVEASEETTEQGSSFRQYAGINDYGIMYWLDDNDELVSIPQGCKIQYPVNYKGFIDDAYMYTEGDATALAKNESITDAALNARGYYKMQDLLTAFGAGGMVGGTLRQLLANKANINFNNIGCRELGGLDWHIQTSKTGVFYATISDMADSTLNILCTLYKESNMDAIWTQTSDKLISCQDDYLGTGWYKTAVIRDTSCATVSDLIAKLKGQLLAYEKA